MWSRAASGSPRSTSWFPLTSKPVTTSAKGLLIFIVRFSRRNVSVYYKLHDIFTPILLHTILHLYTFWTVKSVVLRIHKSWWCRLKESWRQNRCAKVFSEKPKKIKFFFFLVRYFRERLFHKIWCTVSNDQVVVIKWKRDWLWACVALSRN